MLMPEPYRPEPDGYIGNYLLQPQTQIIALAVDRWPSARRSNLSMDLSFRRRANHQASVSIFFGISATSLNQIAERALHKRGGCRARIETAVERSDPDRRALWGGGVCCCSILRV